LTSRSTVMFSVGTLLCCGISLAVLFSVLLLQCHCTVVKICAERFLHKSSILFRCSELRRFVYSTLFWQSGGVRRGIPSLCLPKCVVLLPDAHSCIVACRHHGYRLAPHSTSRITCYRQWMWTVSQYQQIQDGFGGLVVSMLASVSQACGFKPGRSRWIFLV
jgi:hypothetical protein